MDSRQLLVDIYSSVEIDQVRKKLKPDHLRDDIVQHVFLELFSKPSELIIDLHTRGKLKSYIVRMLYKTSVYTKSSFARELGRETPVESFDDMHETEPDDITDDVLKVVDKLYWYKRDILKLYAEKGTLREIYEETGIPIQSLSKTICEARKEIKTKLRCMK